MLRRWRPGDLIEAASSHTHPQDLNTYFGNRKISGQGRDNHWILWSGKLICGITNMEPDRRFAVGSATKNILALTFLRHLDADMEY